MDSSDELVFGPGFGRDVVWDFQSSGPAKDQISFLRGTFADRASLLAAMSQDGGDVVIRLSDADQVRIRNTTVQALNAGNLVLEGSARVSPADLRLIGLQVVPETVQAGTVIARAAAVFDARATRRQFKLIADDSGALQIDATTGDLTLKKGSALDFETRPVVTVTISAVDDAGLTCALIVAIQVANVKEAPTALTFAGQSVKENSVGGTRVGTLAGRDQDPAAQLRYSLVNDGGGRFVVDALTGIVTVKPGASLDYETAPQLTLVGRVSNQDGLTLDRAFTVSLVNVFGTLSGTSNPDNLAGTAEEDQIQGGAGGDTLAGGAGNDTLTGGAGDDSIQGGTGTDTVTYGGTRSDYLIRQDTVTGVYTVTDLRQGAPEGIDRVTGVETFTFSDRTVSGAAILNNAPTGLTLAGGSVTENAAAGTVVGTLAGSDPDAGAAFTYSLLDDVGGRFIVDATTGVIRVRAGAALDYEATPTVTLTARVTDQGGLSFDKAFTLSLANVNEAPTGLTLGGGAVTENAAAGTVVGTLAGLDPDAGAGFTYSLLDDASGRFTVDAATGVIRVKAGAVLDYEATPTVTFSARVTDQGGLTFDKAFTLALANALGVTRTGTATADNLAGTGEEDVLSGGDGNDRINGGIGNDTMAGGAGDDIYWVDWAGDLVVERPGEGRDRVWASVSHVLAADVEDLVLVATALEGTGNDLGNQLRGNDQNNLLRGLAGADGLRGGLGNDTLVGGSGNDTLDGGDGLDVAIYSGARSDYLIRLNTSTGVYTITDLRQGSPDGADRVAGVETFVFSDRVLTGPTVLNNAPNGLSLKGTTVVENATAGTVVGTLAGVDPDAGASFTYSLLDDAGGRFTVDATTGVIRVRPGAILDYEATPTVTLTARVADQGALSYDKAFTISLANAVGVVRTGSAGPDNLSGTGEEDLLGGALGADTLEGGSGNDTLQGGAGADVFVFRRETGRDVITDFQASGSGSDIIQLDRSLAGDWTALLSRTSQFGSDLLIDLTASDRILLKGVQLKDFTQDDVRFA